MITLVLGGARSGKSRLAERLADGSDRSVCYVATAEARDQEMQRRIAHHRERRPAHWLLEEEPLQLADCLRRQDGPGNLLLVDCLTLWLTNLLLSEDPSLFERERDALLGALPGLQSEVLLVSNEVGLGIVPMGELSRRFQDEAGWLNQRLAEISDRVIFTVAGLPHYLKGEPR